MQNYFCGSPVAKKLPILNPNPALPVREEEAKRKWRRTPRYRSVTISPEKNSIHSEKLSLCILSNLSPSSFFSLCAEACDLYDGGQFNGNCLRMKNLELPDCHSATPYILPTSNRIVAKISNFLHFFGVCCKT